MSQRLIDADAMREDWLHNGINEYVYDANSVLDSIDEQPTIDAVPVVRCNDCVHGIGGNGGIACTEFCNVIHKPDDFCSRGERKENYA